MNKNNKTNSSEVQKTEENTRPITTAQSKVLLFISKYIDEKRYPPSYRDISVSLDFASTNAVSNHLDVLDSKGYIKSDRGRARALWLTEKAVDFVNSCKKAKTK